ncbi:MULTISPECIES: NUDIX hydrolase [unclassified Paenibacillus]|uniref:NUDIX hydrolase n=1 Tax=unclassified Paenibacillus TaxID=185978 RepID=UPI00362F017D
MNNLLQVRVTGILVENEQILLVKQQVSNSRGWSLPGGRVEQGETLEDSIVRELLEETGLHTKVVKLLYLCDVPQANPSLIHISFLMQRIDGQLTLPSNEFDKNPITDVRMIPFEELSELGFSDTFVHILRNNFPESGAYKGLKSNIGL